MQNKKIFYSNTGIHTYLKTLFANPPKGYEFIVSSKKDTENLIGKLRESKFASFLYKKIIKHYFNTQPILNKVYSTKSTPDTNLILSTTTTISENKPWILLVLDSIYCLSGMDYNLFLKNKDKFEKDLENKNCKAIIVHTHDSKKLIEKHFSKRISKKIILVTPGIPIKQSEINTEDRKDFNLLFMGSINNPQEFLIKGGLEALEVFTFLNKKYPNIKLTMKCIVPEEYKIKYKNENINFIDSMISEEEVNKIYADSDILLSTGASYFIMAYFESFSHGVPILGYDTFGVSDFIFPGKNGFIVKPSKNLLINKEDYPANVRSEEFKNSIKNIDNEVIKNLASKIELLINNRDLRFKMKKETLEIFKDRFTIEKQNKSLKVIFDKALKNGDQR